MKLHRALSILGATAIFLVVASLGIELRPQFKVGDDVMLNGKKVKIKKIYPDGAFDY